MKNILLFDIDHTLFDTEQLRPHLPTPLTNWNAVSLPFAACIYPDALYVIPLLAQRFRLGVFSVAYDGMVDFQNAKITHGPLAPYFSERLMYIHADMVSLVRSIGPIAESIAYVIDDRADKLMLAKERYPQLKTVRIRRGKYENQEWDYTPDFELPSLLPLPETISG